MSKYNPPSPDVVPLADVAAYVLKKSGTPVTRMTVYNWIDKGKNGIKLKFDLGRITKRGGLFQKFTRREWIDEFLAAAS